MRDHFDDDPRLLPARGQGAALRGRPRHAALPRRRHRHRPGRAGHRVDPGQLRRRTLPGRGRPPDRVSRADREQGRRPSNTRSSSDRRTSSRCWRSTGSSWITTSPCSCRSSPPAGSWPPRTRTRSSTSSRTASPARSAWPRRTLDEDVGRLHGADDPPLEDVGDAARPRQCATLQHPARDRDRRATPRRTSRATAVAYGSWMEPGFARQNGGGLGRAGAFGVLAAVDDVDAPGRSPARRRGAASSSSRGRRSSRRRR